MARKKQERPDDWDDNLVAEIRCGNAMVRITAWKYNSIVDALSWMGLERPKTYEAAQWCGRTHQPSEKKFGDVTIKLVKEEGKQDG